MSNAELASRTQTSIALLDNRTRLTMQSIGNDFSATLEANRSASAMFANGVHDIAVINSDTRLSPEARATAVTNYQNGMRNALGLIGTMGKLPNLDSLVNFAGPAPNTSSTSSTSSGLSATDTVVTNPDGSQTITHADGTKEVRPNPYGGGGYNPGGGGDRGGYSDTSYG